MSLLDQVWIPIQFASVLQASGPGKDARYGVGARRFSLQREEIRLDTRGGLTSWMRSIL